MGHSVSMSKCSTITLITMREWAYATKLALWKHVGMRCFPRHI